MTPRTLDEALAMVPTFVGYDDGELREIPQHVREALAKMIIEPTNDDEYEVGRWLAGGEQ